MHRLLRASILITFGMLILGIFTGCGDDDEPLEEVTDPPQSEDNVGPASATEVVMDPPPRADPALMELSILFTQPQNSR